MASDQDRMKREVAVAALSRVESGMKLGLGTGSTAAVFVELLAGKIRDGSLRDLQTVSTSSVTEAQARSEGIVCRTLPEMRRLDLTVDGADEIDARLRLIKGRGGALLREKIVEQASDRFVVIADASKVVSRLGVGTLPIEVVRFASDLLLERWRREGIDAVIRAKESAPFVTDEQHHIIDVMVPAGTDIAPFAASLRKQAGVVETGLFETEATEALIAGPDGVREMKRDASPSRR